MRAGIFAAGFGSRLGASHRRPKGLTPIGGRPLIDWILQDLESAGAADIVMIINEQSTAIRDHVDRNLRSRAVRWIVQTTPSSMHSFLRVVETLAQDGDEGPFLISTVDTIAPPGTFREFIERCDRVPGNDVVLALTTVIDDEHPLRIDVDVREGERGGPVRAVGSGPYATAGYYLVRSTVLCEAKAARARNLTALRLFFAHLLERGYRLSGIGMPESIDVDRPSDIEAAERLLRTAAS